MLIAGFPMAMILTWAFELTPDGVKPTQSVAHESISSSKAGRIFNFAIFGGVAALIAFF